MADTVTLKAQCHCGAATYRYSLPVSAFPLKSAICHCESCRRVSGQTFATFAVIPSEQRPDVSKLARYASSKTLTRYFCPKCVASVANFEEDEWEFATGVLSVEGKAEIGALNGLLDRVQLWIADAVDGGSSIWMAGEWDGKRHLRERGSEAVSDRMLQDMVSKADEQANASSSDVLQANCHCGSVNITIARPDDHRKYGAGVDACISCRKVSGFEITSWVTLDPEKVSISEKGLDLDTPKLAHYQTSHDVHRYFCKECGATIFYLKEGKIKDPGIDLAVGLLDSRKGVRAEDWLDWTKYEEFVAYSEDAGDEAFVQCLLDGVVHSRQGQVKQ